VTSELKAKASLREFTGVYNVPEANDVQDFKQVHSRTVRGYSAKNCKHRLWKAKGRENHDNWRYRQFNGEYQLV